MQAGDRVHDRYVLESRLGTGGMSQVWCAHDERLERQVAVKFLSDRLTGDPGNLVRFFSEAQQIARIQHPNVVTVLDFGETQGHPYIVMEHLTGGSLADLAGEPVAPSTAAKYVTAAAAAAGAAHDLGIVHRDIKPNNILLDDDGEVRLADFGIAAYEGAESMTQTGEAVGSPHYISPEQAQGEQTSPASDVYALGIVLYELVTGRKLFENDNITAVVLAHIEQSPESPSDYVDDLDERLEAVIMRCLAKQPEHRFDDGAALAAALEGLSAGEDITVPVPLVAPAPDDAGGPDGDRRRRKRRALLVAAAIAAAGVATAMVVSSSSPEGGDVAIAETPSPSPTPTREGRAEEEAPASTAADPSPSPTADEETADEGEEDEETAEPSPSPSPSPTRTPKPSPSPSPTSSPSSAVSPTPASESGSSSGGAGP